MNSQRYTLPVLAAAALHSALLFGFDSSQPLVSPPDDSPQSSQLGIVPPLPVFPPEEEIVEVSEVSPPGARAAMEALPPPVMLPEPPHALIETVFAMQPTRVPPQVGEFRMDKIPADWAPGNPLSDGDGLGDGIGAVSLSMLDSAPQATFQAVPMYPPEMKRDGTDGEVMVTFVVNKAGKVAFARSDQASRPEFAREAVRAVERWRFKPGLRLGQPVSFRMTVPILFRLE